MEKSVAGTRSCHVRELTLQPVERGNAQQLKALANDNGSGLTQQQPAALFLRTHNLRGATRVDRGEMKGGLVNYAGCSGDV